MLENTMNDGHVGLSAYLDRTNLLLSLRGS